MMKLKFQEAERANYVRLSHFFCGCYKCRVFLSQFVFSRTKDLISN